jgi:hypothetical protein
MMTPKISPPVREIPEIIVQPALRPESPIDADTGLPAVNPETGKVDFFLDFERGSNPFPNSPQRFPLNPDVPAYPMSWGLCSRAAGFW